MEEYRLDDLTIKEHLLRLAERGNKSFTESLNPGVEHVLGIRIPDLRQLAKQISRANWEEYLLTADSFTWRSVCCKVWCWDTSSPMTMWNTICIA